MEYKLFDEYITLQALLKDIGIIHSGGAAKGFLAENTVLLNNETEQRRGKKIRVGDYISLPNRELTINLVAPSDKERQIYQEEYAEKERIAILVKKLNKENRQTQKFSQKTQTKGRKSVRFPGT